MPSAWGTMVAWLTEHRKTSGLRWRTGSWTICDASARTTSAGWRVSTCETSASSTSGIRRSSPGRCSTASSARSAAAGERLAKVVEAAAHRPQRDEDVIDEIRAFLHGAVAILVRAGEDELRGFLAQLA